MSRWAIMLILAGGIVIMGCAAKAPTNVGVTRGQFTPCPDRPNCVSSQSSSQRHHIAPIVYQGQPGSAFEKLKQIIRELEGTQVVSETGKYLHVTFRSRIMGFIDDVEFYFPAAPLIHVRSASRVGYWDLGANRRRIERIRSLFHSGKPSQ
jgi:uncharacterized protein (DUF1499 family)